MVIVGRSVETFEEANYATLARFKVNGEWELASTNHGWETTWAELVEWDGETVELSGVEETFQIREDEFGEYIVLEQGTNSLLIEGEYETRLRPYVEESRTERKPWNPEEVEETC